MVWIRIKAHLNKGKRIYFSLLITILLFCLSFLNPDRLFRLGGYLLSGNCDLLDNLEALLTEAPFKIHILDVGQGDASLFQAGQNFILLDTGPPDQAPLLLAYLKGLGVNKLDRLILTHPHDDHIGGAKAILKSFPVSSLVMSRDFMDNPNAWELMRMALSLGIPLEEPFKGAGFTWQGVRFHCLHPEKKPYDNPNNLSNVWEVVCEKTKCLFLGDLELDEATGLPQGPYDLLRMGHHGSDTSFDEGLKRKLRPAFYLISCGVKNKFGHPKPAVMKLIKESGRPYFRTDRSGSLVLVQKGSGFKMRDYRLRP